MRHVLTTHTLHVWPTLQKEHERCIVCAGATQAVARLELVSERQCRERHDVKLK